MAKHILSWIVVGILCMSSLKAQIGLQLGGNFGLGRSYTQVDLTQATFDNLSAGPAAVAVLGLELAWQFKKHWRVSGGINYMFQDYRIDSESRPFDTSVFTQRNASTFPFMLSFLIPGGANSKKGFILGAGTCIQLFEQTSGGSRSSSRLSDGVQATGFASFFQNRTVAETALSLQFLAGQSWLVGRKRRMRVEANLIYSIGLQDVWTGEYFFWDVPPPEDFPRTENFLDVMPEPTESYNSISSRGSFLAIQLKFFVNFLSNPAG